jgi:hypothetical protein
MQKPFAGCPGPVISTRFQCYAPYPNGRTETAVDLPQPHGPGREKGSGLWGGRCQKLLKSSRMSSIEMAESL